MKKLFIVLAAAFVAVACQKDANDLNVTNGDAVVSFAIETPVVAGRAYSDGNTATHLQYAVYDANGVELTNLTNTAAEIHGSTTVDLQLVTGNDYTVIFWAAAPNAPYTVNFGGNLANAAVSVDYTNALSNDENRDAFFKCHDFTVRGTQTETIELRRPFAQLNIGTNDYLAAKDAGYEPTLSAVTVKNIYNTLKLADGAVDGAGEVVFGYNTIPTTETFPVANYDYLSMNYLLVAADKALVDIEFGYGEANATPKTRIVGSVPVQRNYRTNIYGQLMTSDVDFNVIIVPEYEDAYNLQPVFASSAVELVTVLENAAEGTTVVLNKDVDFGAVALGELKNVEIEGNGAAIRFVTDDNTKLEGVTIRDIDAAQFVTGAGQSGAFFVIDENAQIDNLVIENCNLVGDGKKNSYGITGENPNATITVKNCSFSNLGYAIQTITGGGYASLVVEACTFENILSWALLPQYGYTGDLTINNCTFNNTKGGLVKTGAFNGVFTFTNNTITNSVGHDGADSKWFDVTAANKVVSNNTKDGAAWAPEAAQGLK